MFSIVDQRSLASIMFLDVQVLTVESRQGARFERVAIRHPGAVAVVAMDDDEVLLIKQYRAPVDRELLELPAGKLDQPGEDPAVAVVRELEEEIGYTARTVELLARFYTGPGFTDEQILLYMAADLHAVPARPHGAEEQVAEVVRVKVADIPAMLASGDICDAKTIIGLQSLLLGTR